MTTKEPGQKCENCRYFGEEVKGRKPGVPAYYRQCGKTKMIASSSKEYRHPTDWCDHWDAKQ